MSSSTSDIESLVCEACHSQIFNGPCFQKARLNGLSYNTSWGQIQGTYNQGCAWCDMIFFEVETNLRTLHDKDQTEFQGSWEEIEEIGRIASEEEMTVEISFRDDHHESGGPTTLFIHYLWAKNGQALFMSVITICTTAGMSTYRALSWCLARFLIHNAHIDDNASRYIPVRNLVCEMSSPHTYQLLMECLDRCNHGEDEHRNCLKYKQSALPTRVLDCQSPHKPRILVSDGIEGAYVALSYVWGEDQPHCTKKSNLGRYIDEGLDMGVTPQTIKDAIQVTHMLGLRYLWIDTYCIIQDSIDDKMREIGQMSNIYQDAYFTIIAAKAKKASMGFLQDCIPPEPSFRLPFYCSDGVLGSMILLPQAHRNPYDTGMEPMSSRGWCFQERLLSPRGLVYASHTLQYICQQGTMNIGNGFNEAMPRGMQRLPQQFFLGRGELGSQAGHNSEEVQELAKLWHRVLQDYSARSITNPADRLNAISAVAKEFQRIFGSRYIAGLWEHHLLGDLLWIRSVEDPLPRPVMYRAPSWSWASVDGIVYNPGHFVNPEDAYHCDILDCQVTPLDKSSPLGEVTGGYLRLNGRLKKLTWDPVEWKLYAPGIQQEAVIIGAAYADATEHLEVKEVWALPMVLTKKKDGIPNSRRSLQSLLGILLKRIDETQNKYRRIGSFRSSLDDKPEKLTFEDTPRQEIIVI